jgi:hypothetical protein
MNGNISWDGVQKDMEWMKRVGIAGLQSFDAGRATPQVVEKRLPYMSAVGSLSWVQFDYGHPVTIRGVTFATPVAARYYDALEPRRVGIAPTQFRFEASDDGRAWHDTGAKVQAGLPERTISVNAHARMFRFVSVKQPPDPPPTRIPRFGRPPAPPPDVIPINELVLRGEPSIHSFEDKAAFVTNGNYYGLPSGTAGGAAPKPSEVLDLTGKMQQNGRLDWTPPAGEWDVLRIGYSLTGAMNRPASPEGTGLEVDKLDAAAVKRYMDHYIAMYRDATQ